MVNVYTSTIQSDDKNTYNSLPANITLPTNPGAYFTMPWLAYYTPGMVADIVYANSSLFWLILVVNNIKNPYAIKVNDNIRVLKPEFIKDIKVNG